MLSLQRGNQVKPKHRGRLLWRWGWTSWGRSRKEAKGATATALIGQWPLSQLLVAAKLGFSALGALSLVGHPPGSEGPGIGRLDQSARTDFLGQMRTFFIGALPIRSRTGHSA